MGSTGIRSNGFAAVVFVSAGPLSVSVPVAEKSWNGQESAVIRMGMAGRMVRGVNCSRYT